MSDLSLTVERQKCQGFGSCARLAPNTFVIDADKRATLIDGATADDVLMKAARSCPYKAIIVRDRSTNEQLHPRRYRTSV